MNIYLRELRANRRSLIVWSVVTFLFTVMGVAKFSAYYNNPSMLAILNDLPPAMLDAFNFRAFNLTTLVGFFGIMFTYFALLLGIAAAMWGADIITKEERDRTVEFSLTLPVTRNRVVTAKALAALTNCILLLAVTWVSSLLMAQLYNPDAAFYNFLTLEMVAAFLIQVVFLAVGLLLGCAMKRYKLASAVAVTILLATYFISFMSSMSSSLDSLKYLTPFRYFDPGALLRQSSLNTGYVLLSLLIVVVCMIGAYFAYQRRDLYI